MKKVFVLVLIFVLTACDGAEMPAPTTATPEPEATHTAVPASPTPIPPTPTAVPDPLYTGTDGFPWWNDVTFYEIFVRSFYDSDGDGVGDINGLIEKLDYLNDGDPGTDDDLGVTGIWLMPIAVSPSYHGYDVVDYFQVDPEYGSNDDFKRLMEEAHARDIRVIVDLVMNHTSVEHPWFIDSQHPDSDFRDWYIWADENPGWRGPEGQVVWHRGENGFYYGVFWSGMPDLNFENPEVTEAMYEAAQFWLEEMEVDGFRLDAIKHIVEEGQGQQNTGSTHQWLQSFFNYYKQIAPNALTVGEAWTATNQVLDYTGDEVDIAFQFDLALDIINTAGSGLAPIFADTQREVVESFPPHQYATFITNHDQNRVLSQLRGDEGQARVAASILLTGTGVPFIYYGEEIGQFGTKPDEDIRLPMQWESDDAGVGFTEGTPWRLPFDDYSVRSVELQTDDPDSLLSHYRALIHLRNEHEALRIGSWTPIEANSPRLYAFLRESDDESILVLINVNRNAVDEYALDLAESMLTAEISGVTLYGNDVEALPDVNGSGGFSGYVPYSEIPPQSTHLILLRP